MTQTGSILTILYVNIDLILGQKLSRNSGSNILTRFPGQFNAVCVGGILTRIRVTI